MKRITVMEYWTRNGGIRKIGDGPWEPINFEVYPYLILESAVTDWMQERWVTPKEAQLLLNA